MNLLFLTLSPMRDVNIRGIYTDLMRKFRDEGHQVYVVGPRERRLQQKTSLVEQDGIHVLGVRTLNIVKTNVVEKGVGTLLIEYQYKKAINEHLAGVKFDLILYSTPPITFTGVIRMLKKRDDAISYLLLKDIFPQNAIDLQMFSKKNPLYWLFRRKEKLLYRISDYIGCMSPANVEFVLTHNPEISVDKVEVNPNSVEPVKYEESIDKCEIRKRYGLPLDVPVFIYGGNLGKPQGVSFLLEVLERNKGRKDCYFLIVGNGTEYIRIKEWFGKCNVSNAQLLAGLPKQEYDQLVSSCDVGLIFLDPRFTIPNYPSRLLAYLESKMPVLAVTDVNTDIGRIAWNNGFGAWCESGDINAFNRIMEIFFDDKLVRQMGEKGYEYLLENYTVSKTYEIIMQHLNKG